MPDHSALIKLELSRDMTPEQLAEAQRQLDEMQRILNEQLNRPTLVPRRSSRALQGAES